MHAPRCRSVLLASCALLLGAPVAATGGDAAATRLQVDVAGLPDGTAADVTVTGPGDLRRPLTASTTLDGVAAGAYVVSAAPVRRSGRFADELWEPAQSEANVTVRPGATAAARVAYRLCGGTGMLWVASANDSTLHGLGNGQLGAAGRPAARAVSDAGGRYVRGVAISRDGAHLWASGDCTGTLMRFDAGQLAGAGARKPAVVTPAGDGRCLDGLAIAPDGRLWAADRSSGQVLAFSPQQLAKPGRPAPELVLESADPQRPSLRNPSGVAFDAAGNLWVTNTDGGDTVVMFAADQRAASGKPAPKVVLSSTSAGSIRSPRGLAFDASGNLWVANRYGPVVKFTPAQLGASGAPKPAATLPVDAISAQTDLVGLAFDEAGNLWVANRVNAPRLAMWRAADLAKGGVPPATIVDGAFATPGHLAFSLPPRGLPLAAAPAPTGAAGAAAGAAR